jgi:hypothetical protein
MRHLEIPILGLARASIFRSEQYCSSRWHRCIRRSLGGATQVAVKRKVGMLRQRGKLFKVLHFCCNPTIAAEHGSILKILGYRVVRSSNGFDTIRLSVSENVDAVVLELDRNYDDVQLIAQEIEGLQVSIPTVVVVHMAQTLESLCDLVDAVILKKSDSAMLMKSLRQVLPGRNRGPVSRQRVPFQALIEKY